MEQIKVSIIIINYNSGDFLSKCLDSIQPSRFVHEIIVVDNNSTDHSYQCARDKHRVRLIRCQENGGYAKGANTGINSSAGELILVANPDIVFGAGAIEAMVSCAVAHPETGMVGPKIKNFDDTLQYECKRNQPDLLNSLFYFLGLQNRRGNHYVTKEEGYYEKSEYVNAISGSCMLFKREALERCGLFDEDFFMYGEDLDMCHRMIRAGYKIFYNSRAVVHHYKGGCTKDHQLALKYKADSLIRLMNKRNQYNSLQRFMVGQMIKIGYQAKRIKENMLQNN